jgi:hypothetical protein
MEKLIKWFKSLYHPYTIKESIILNLMQCINFFIGKRFQFLHYFNFIKEYKIKHSNKTIFVDDFISFNDNIWQKEFPWGNGNNEPSNVCIFKDSVIMEMNKENYIGYWGGQNWNYINTTGMIYSKNIYPVEAVYEFKVKFSNVKNINQAVWLLRLKDEPLPKQIEEIDFEYYGDRITMSQHWGNGYNHKENHRQDSFGFKIDLSKKWHILKFKITKRNIYWYIDNILVKWHFIGVPKLEQHIVLDIGNCSIDSEHPNDIGNLNLDKLPAYFKCDYIRIIKN